MPTTVSELVRACAWCGSLHLAGRWRPARAALDLLGVAHEHDLGPITHDICPSCASRF